MAKRRVKKRTHMGSKPGLGAGSHPATTAAKPGSRIPKSMVIRVGASELGPSLSQLVKDVRRMMEPETATRLKERRSNKLRDYTTMAGPLGVTHLLLFSRSRNGNTNLRLALTPRGPTFHFRVEQYSLCKDIQHSTKRPKTAGTEYQTSPLLVMNNFSSKDDEKGEGAKPATVPKHLETLATNVFQSLFPPINPTTAPLKAIKRVLLLDRSRHDPSADAAQYSLTLRHYAIETRTAKSVPKPLRKLDAAGKLSHGGTNRKRGQLPNLARLNDVSDYLLDPHVRDGFTSGSESEPETDAEVEVVAARARKVQKRKSQGDGREGGEVKNQVEKKAIKLCELGPRMKLRLTKVEEGVCNGRVMWHDYMHRSQEEMKEMERVHAERRQMKERRKAEQKANVERKRGDKKVRAEGVDADDEEEEEEDEEMDGEEEEDDDDDDDEMRDSSGNEDEGGG